MTRTPDWQFFTKDLDRTDQRRDWRFSRQHVLADQLVPAADSTEDPVGRAACREFLERDGDLIAAYQGARGRRKQRLQNRLLERLAHAGIISPGDRTRLRDYAPCHWPRLRAA